MMDIDPPPLGPAFWIVAIFIALTLALGIVKWVELLTS